MTYLYETLPILPAHEVKHYEIEQGMNDLPLAKHPETGESIRRVIIGGWGRVATKPGSDSSSKGGCASGPSGCC